MEPSPSYPLIWNKLVASFNAAHVLQTWQWGQVKSSVAWQPIYCLWFEDYNRYNLLSGPLPAICNQLDKIGRPSLVAGAAMLLQRTIPVGGFAARMRALYIPKGPLLDWSNTPLRHQVLLDLHTLAHKQGGIFIKIDPDVRLGTGFPGSPQGSHDSVGEAVCADLQSYGWGFSDEQVQFRNTVIIDLTPNEDTLLANMKQKTRYNIRLATRKGVRIRAGTLSDLDLLYQMYAETSVRDRFVIRDEAYYHTVWNTFLRDSYSPDGTTPGAEILIAEVDQQAVAGLIIFFFAGKAWYLYGMSRQAHREMMPNYLLQWEAMLRAKAAGCKTYDLWGAPDDLTESDPMWGVYRFKESLGGRVVRHIGAWDLPINPFLYSLYTQILPRLLNVMRKRGRAKTQQGIN